MKIVAEKEDGYPVKLQTCECSDVRPEPWTCRACGGTSWRPDSDWYCATIWCDDCGEAHNPPDPTPLTPTIEGRNLAEIPCDNEWLTNESDRRRWRILACASPKGEVILKRDSLLRLIDHIDALEERVAHWRDEVGKVHSCCDRLRADAKFSREELRRQCDHVDRVDAELVAAKRPTGTVEEYADLATRYHGALDRIHELHGELAAAKEREAELDAAGDEIDRLEHRAVEYRDEIKRLKIELASAKEGIRQARREERGQIAQLLKRCGQITAAMLIEQEMPEVTP